MARTTDEDRRYPYYPAFLDLRRKRVVVVGGGEIATGKVRGLLPCGPEPLVVIAPEASEFIRAEAAAGHLAWLPRPYQDGDLAGAQVAFGATDDRAINALVATEARRRGILVLATDDVPNCDFIAPSIVARGDLIVAASTGGRSPAFARWVRERLSRDLPAHWGALLDVAAAVRERLGPQRARVSPEAWQRGLDEVEPLVRSLVAAQPDPRAAACLDRGSADLAVEVLYRRLLPRAADGSNPPLSSRVRETGEASDLIPRLPPRGEEAEGADAATSSPSPLAKRREPEAGSGFVSLVGAGPGDPELVTLRGLRRLREADAVVYDRLIDPALLDHCPPDAERYDVGKSPGRHSCRQEEIDALLVRLARAGKRVVRLKGGDPFVFGRGGEEVLALAAAGIPYEIVPGVSSAIAVPGAAGIPVTHRGVAASVTIATGHGRGSDGDLDHDWAALARQRGTLVFLMAVENLEQIVERLLAHGRPPGEPAAMVQAGTTPRQREVWATLATIAPTARAARIASPAVLVVGPTVALAESLARATAPAGAAASPVLASPTSA